VGNSIQPLAPPNLHTVGDGLRLIVTPMPHARSVGISVYLAAGSRFEPAEEEAGLAHFLEHLCFKGTPRRPHAMDVSREIDGLGGTINAATNREFTVYYGKVTSGRLEPALDLLADMLRESLFADAEVERERGVILEELAAVEDSPAEQSGVLLDQLLWPGQPHGRDIAGTEESVTNMPRDRIFDYYRQQYVPNGAVVALAGAVDDADATALAERLFGDWPAGEPRDWVRDTGAQGDRAAAIEKDTEQVHLTIGLPGLSIHDPDRYAADLLSIVLGEGMSSRLFARLREELGLCYDIHTYVGHLLDTGMFGVYAGVDPTHAIEAVNEISKELARAREPVAAEELQRAKEVARSRLELRIEDTRAVSSLYGSQAILDLAPETPDQLAERTMAVTIEDLERVAGRLLRDDAIHLASVGPCGVADLKSALSLA
jgi:predicted Zn-dependent peptidase